MSNDAAKPTQSPCEVLFMPWADLGTPLRIGPFQFVPWSSLSVVDSGIRDYLDTYFGRHVDHFGRVVDSVAILLHDSHDFTPSAYRPYEQPRDAADALIFSTIAPQVVAAMRANDQSLAPPTANRYQLVKQNFWPGDEDVAVRVGDSVHAGRIERITFPVPWGVGGSFALPDEDMAGALGELLTSTAPSDLRVRMFRALEWFRVAHTVGDGTSDFSKVAMMATAFEILLQFPRGRKRWFFVNKIESLLRRPETMTTTVNDPQGQPCTVGRPAEWASDFYRLRNRVVHGDELQSADLRFDGWITHLIVADVVFWQCVASELYQRDFLGRSISTMKADPLQAILAEPLENQLLGFEAHTTLKWKP